MIGISDTTGAGRARIAVGFPSPSQRPVAHPERAPLSRSGGSRFDTCRADRCLDPESEGPGCDPGMSGGGTRQAPQGELIMWREHPAVAQLKLAGR